MYSIRYKRTDILPDASLWADNWLGVDLGDAMIGFALPIMPDGLIVQFGDEWLETYRGQLRPVEPGIKVTKKRSADI
jgi:hypothetical protein